MLETSQSVGRKRSSDSHMAILKKWTWERGTCNKVVIVQIGILHSALSSVILLRHSDYEFKARLGYVRPHLKNKQAEVGIELTASLVPVYCCCLLRISPLR